MAKLELNEHGGDRAQNLVVSLGDDISVYLDEGNGKGLLLLGVITRNGALRRMAELVRDNRRRMGRATRRDAIMEKGGT